MLLDFLYLAAAVLLTPYFLWRRFVKRKQSASWRSKLGYVGERSGGVPRVWIHAVSVGEAVAAETLVKALRQMRPDLDVVISTTTTTGQEVAVKRYGAEKVFYYPLDLSCAVKRSLNRVKPSLLVLMELEVWPNMTAEAVRRGIPVVVVNGRATERAARRYRRFWFLVGPSFRRVQRWLVQSEEYAARLRDLGVDAQKIEVSGNLKYDALDTALDPDARAGLRAKLGIAPDAPVLVGGSTHPTEETALLAAYKQLRGGQHPELRLILAPRHPERAAAVESEITSAGFPCLRLSTLRASNTQDSALGTQHSVLLVDTVGELKGMYKAADVAFVGGSLIPHGGQNVMEPCGLGVPVVHGPHMHNFKEALEILRSCNGSVEVARDGLPAAVEQLLRDRAAAQAMAGRAREAFLRQQGAARRAAEYLLEQILNLPPRGLLTG
jgi:3-deoxy-D-manno-octulosonic-acid transferase